MLHGVAQAKTLQAYIDALTDAPTTKWTPETLKKQLEGVEENLAAANSALQKLTLIQRKLDIEKQLGILCGVQSFEQIEQAFVDIGLDLATRKGITYEAFRLIGIPAGVLERAGIKR